MDKKILAAKEAAATVAEASEIIKFGKKPTLIVGLKKKVGGKSKKKLT